MVQSSLHKKQQHQKGTHRNGNEPRIMMIQLPINQYSPFTFKSVWPLCLNLNESCYYVLAKYLKPTPHIKTPVCPMKLYSLKF